MTDQPTDAPVTQRHPGTTEALSNFGFEHLRPDLQELSKPFHDFAHEIVTAIPDSPALVHALNKLVEAKDWTIRAAAKATAQANRI